MSKDKSIKSAYKFEELRVYQEAIEWVNDVYSATSKWPKDEVFGLTGQWRRASVSVGLNIAEGSSRTTKDFCHFLTIARGSCYECAAIIEVAKNQGYLNNTEYGYHYDRCNKIARTLNSLRSSLQRNNDSNH